MDDKAVIIFGLLGLGLLFMLTRGSSNRHSSYSESIALPFKPTNRVSEGHHYKNKEVREITYNEDGLPTRIVIHRDARVS